MAFLVCLPLGLWAQSIPERNLYERPLDRILGVPNWDYTQLEKILGQEKKKLKEENQARIEYINKEFSQLPALAEKIQKEASTGTPGGKFATYYQQVAKALQNLREDKKAEVDQDLSFLANDQETYELLEKAEGLCRKLNRPNEITKSDYDEVAKQLQQHLNTLELRRQASQKVMDRYFDSYWQQYSVVKMAAPVFSWESWVDDPKAKECLRNRALGSLILPAELSTTAPNGRAWRKEDTVHLNMFSEAAIIRAMLDNPKNPLQVKCHKAKEAKAIYNPKKNILEIYDAEGTAKSGGYFGIPGTRSKYDYKYPVKEAVIVSEILSQAGFQEMAKLNDIKVNNNSRQDTPAKVKKSYGQDKNSEKQAAEKN
jgi:hypothetical protein